MCIRSLLKTSTSQNQKTKNEEEKESEQETHGTKRIKKKCKQNIKMDSSSCETNLFKWFIVIT